MSAGDRVTIYDVARAAGVSPSTVSRTLTRPGRVSVATARQVRQAIDELGYESAPSSAYTDADTRVIALSVQRLANPIYSDILSGFREYFDEGYVPIVVESNEDAHQEAANLRQILPFVDGVILASSLLTDSQIVNIHKQKPTVLIQRKISGVPSIMFDVLGGVGHLLDLFKQFAHNEVLYLSGPDRSWTNGVRWRAIQAEAESRNLKVTRTEPFEPSPRSGFDAVAVWQDSKATGVIAFNDLQATGFLKGVDRMGLKVPQDVSVASFDNSIAAVVAEIPLTSVGGSNFNVGRHAAELLTAHMRGRRDKAPEIVLPMKTYFRKSLALAPPK